MVGNVEITGEKEVLPKSQFAVKGQIRASARDFFGVSREILTSPPQIPFFVVGKMCKFSAISYGAWYPLGNLRFPLRDGNFFTPDLSTFLNLRCHIGLGIMLFLQPLTLTQRPSLIHIFHIPFFLQSCFQMETRAF